MDTEYKGYTHRRRNRRISLSLADRPGRRKIIEGKDHYVLEMVVAGSVDGTFASARKSYVKTVRAITPMSIQLIVNMFFDLTYGFRISAISKVTTSDGAAMLLTGNKQSGGKP